MTTMGTINDGHFHGGRNLTTGQRHNSDAILEEFLEQAKADITGIGTAPTMTPGTEAADVIAVAFASPVASIEQYIAEVVDTNMEVNDAAFTIAETGVGSEIAGSGKARLIFKTDAAGAAEISITDVVGASGSTVYLMVRPLFESADVATICAPVMVSATFD